MRNQLQKSTLWLDKFLGTCQHSSGKLVPPGYFYESKNYEILPDGTIAPRQGFTRIGAMPDGKPIIATLKTDAATLQYLVATTEHLYSVGVTFASTTPESAADASISTTLLDTFDAASFDLTITKIKDGNTTYYVWGGPDTDMKKWTGSGSASACTGAPQGCPVGFLNYLAVFKVKNALGSVHFSVDPGNPDLWEEDGAPKFLGFGDEITGVFNYSGLVIFTKKKAFLFSGDPDAPVGVSELSQSTGCVSHNTIADCEGVLVWLSHAGPVAWSGGGIFPSMNIGKPDNPQASGIFRDADQINHSSTTYRTCGLYNPVKKTYYLFTPLLDNTFRVFTFSFPRRAWMVWEAIPSCMFMLEVPGSPEKMAVGMVDGAFCVGDWGSLQEWDGISEKDYNYFVVTGDMDSSSPMTTKILRSIVIGVGRFIGPLSQQGDRSIRIDVSGDFDRSTTGNDAEVATGNFILGISKMGDRVYNTQSRFTEIRQPLALRSKNIALTISGRGDENAAAIAYIGIQLRENARRDKFVGRQ